MSGQGIEIAYIPDTGLPGDDPDEFGLQQQLGSGIEGSTMMPSDPRQLELIGRIHCRQGHEYLKRPRAIDQVGHCDGIFAKHNWLLSFLHIYLAPLAL